MDAEETTLPLIAGRYRLLRVLAVGGMGELYLASAQDEEIEGLEHLVVIKRILPEYASDPSVVTMFLIEARIAARLDHPNVVRVYDMGRADGSVYFTMEYLHGTDLNRLIEGARRLRSFPLQHVLTIALGICAGLHFAHEMRRVDGRPMGIVHRDVSPSNVFITFQGGIKLVDFGIAKVASSSQMTQAGMRKGKVAYMAPEQVLAGPIDRRTDVFAIGILLYEMVTLTDLFDGPNEYEIMEQIAEGRLQLPSSRRDGIHPDLEAIILKALAHNPRDRYQTADELAQALEQFVHDNQITLSLVGLRNFVKQIVGNVPFPWYGDDRDPGEADAVDRWFRGALPLEESVEVEDVEVSLNDMALDDVLGDDAQEPEPAPDEPPPDDIPDDELVTPPPQLRPRRLPHVLPQQPLPPPPPLPWWQKVDIPRMIVIGSATALMFIGMALVIRSCRSSQPAAPAAPPAAEAPASP